MNLRSFTVEANFGANKPARAVIEASALPLTLARPLWEEVSLRLKESHFDTVVYISRTARSRPSIALPRGTTLRHYGIQQTSWATRTELATEAQLIDAESNTALSHLINEISGARTLIVFDAVLEALWDIRPMITTARQILLCNPRNLLLIRHLDAAFCDPSLFELGHREWTVPQLSHVLQQAGLQVAHSVMREGSNLDYAIQSATCDRAHWEQFLAIHHLPPAGISSLHVTTEHTDFDFSGGIGTYAEVLATVIPADRFGMVFVPFPRRQARVSHSNLSLIIADYFFHEDELLRHPLQDAVWLVVQHVLFYYPNVGRIEFQDYLGIGCRLVHAREAGLMRPGIQLEVLSHGNQIYLEAGLQSWLGVDAVETATYELISLERADRSVFPSRFLHRLYLDNGIKLRERNVVFEGYPYEWGPPPVEQPFEPMDTIIFYGKQSRMKGYIDLLRAVVRLKPLVLLGIKEVLFIAPKTYSDHETQSALAAIEQEAQVTFRVGTRTEVRELLTSYRNRAICVLPYLGDNSPFCIREVVDVGCPLLCYAAGGIPEMFPTELRDDFLCDPNVESLMEALLQRFADDPRKRRDRLSLLRATMIEKQREVDEGLRRRFRDHPVPEKKLPDYRLPRIPADSPITVIVPAYNVPKRFLDDLTWALSLQAIPPFEIILADDGSSPDFRNGYREVARDSALPFRIVRSEMNWGLAAARNLALQNVKTPFFANIDADDIPLPRFLLEITNYLSANGTIAAAGHFIRAFEDGQDWRSFARDAYTFRPLGEGYTLGHIRNCFGHANIGFRTDEIKAIGGWDESDRSMWEDWALYLRMSSLQKRIGVIPSIGVLLRVRSDSMRRTYGRFPAERRLARACKNMPLYEALRLQGLMSQLLDVEHGGTQSGANQHPAPDETVVAAKEHLSPSKALFSSHGVYAPFIHNRKPQ